MSCHTLGMMELSVGGGCNGVEACRLWVSIWNDGRRQQLRISDFPLSFYSLGGRFPPLSPWYRPCLLCPSLVQTKVASHIEAALMQLWTQSGGALLVSCGLLHWAEQFALVATEVGYSGVGGYFGIVMDLLGQG